MSTVRSKIATAADIDEIVDKMSAIDPVVADQLADVVVDLAEHYREQAKKEQIKDLAGLVKHIKYPSGTSMVERLMDSSGKFPAAVTRAYQDHGEKDFAIEAVLIAAAKPVFFERWGRYQDFHSKGALGFWALEDVVHLGLVDLLGIKRADGSYPVRDVVGGLSSATVERANGQIHDRLNAIGCSATIHTDGLNDGELFCSFSFDECGWGLRVNPVALARLLGNPEILRELAGMKWGERTQMQRFVGHCMEALGIDHPLQVKDPHAAPNPEESIDAALEGFHCRLRFFVEDDEQHREKLTGVKHALRHFRARLERLAPQLLGSVPVVELSFTEHEKTSQYHGELLHYGAWYDAANQTIRLFIKDQSPDLVARITSTIAHEFGHHVYKTMIGPERRHAWSAAIDGSVDRLHIDDILDLWGLDVTPAAFMEELRQTNPVLWLQLEGLRLWKNRPGYFRIREDLEQMLERGTKLVVPKMPTTPYGSAVPEEAFCEVMGQLVAYGPRTVLPWVREMFNMALGLPQQRLTTGSTMLEIYQTLEALADRIVGIHRAAEPRETVAVDLNEPPQIWLDRDKPAVVAPAKQNPFKSEFKQAARLAGHPEWAGGEELSALENIAFEESGFVPHAKNPVKGNSAFGLFQFIRSTWEELMPAVPHGQADTPEDILNQIVAGYKYVAKRYRTPQRAWAFWQATKQKNAKLAPPDMQERAQRWIDKNRIGW